jgi:hypothetical protein
MMFLLKYWKYAAFAIVVMGCLGVVRASGYTAAETKYKGEIATMVIELQAARIQALADAQERTLLLGTIAVTEAALAAKARAKTEVVTETVVKWKVRYAANPDAGKCDITPEFVRVHTAAATNRVSPAPTSGPEFDGVPGGITDIDVLSVDTANYATCHKWADQLRHWQSRQRKIEEVRSDGRKVED